MIGLDLPALKRALADHPEVSPELRVRTLATLSAVRLASYVLGTVVGLGAIAGGMLLFWSVMLNSSTSVASVLGLLTAVVGGAAGGAVMVGGGRLNARLVQRVLKRAEGPRPPLALDAVSASASAIAVPTLTSEVVPRDPG